MRSRQPRSPTACSCGCPSRPSSSRSERRSGRQVDRERGRPGWSPRRPWCWWEERPRPPSALTSPAPTHSAVQVPQGSALRTGTFLTPGGQVLGQIVAYHGSPSWVFMHVDVPKYNGPIKCTLSGRRRLDRRLRNVHRQGRDRAVLQEHRIRGRRPSAWRQARHVDRVFGGRGNLRRLTTRSTVQSPAPRCSPTSRLSMRARGVRSRAYEHTTATQLAPPMCVAWWSGSVSAARPVTRRPITQHKPTRPLGAGGRRGHRTELQLDKRLLVSQRK